MVLGNFYLKLLVPVDMRGTVVIALDADIAVGVQLCFLPFPTVEVRLGQRFERAPLERLEAIAARDTKTRMTPIIDALDSLLERLIDLRERGESRAPIAEP